MDAMRSVLMMLGIFSHTSYIYHPTRTWKINSEQTMEIIGWLSNAQLAFRMPAFFVISGFFCALTLCRYSPSKFLKVRLVRIALPMIVTGCTLNLLQSYLLGRFGLVEFSLNWHFLEGNWVSHLWFLRNLVIYFLVSALFVIVLDSYRTPINNFIKSVTDKINILVIMLILPTAFIVFLVLNQLGFPLYGRWFFDTIKMYQLIYYLPYFLVGILFYTIPPLLERFCTINLWLVIGTLIVAIIALQPVIGESAVPMRIGYEYIYALISWASICVVFKLFRFFCNQPSTLWTFVSDASYSVYLFHHILVVVFGYIAVSNNVHPLVAMGVIMPITLVLTLLNHVYVIKRVPVLRFLFNGK